MASQLTVWAGYLAILIMGAAVLATVSRRERFVFVAGVLLLLLGLTFLAGTPGAVVASVGVVAIVAAAVPMLREPAPST